MKKFLLTAALCVLTLGLNAQTWTAPAVPGADLASVGSETLGYFYNVEANAFLSYGMDWNTNACATRLTNGETAVSNPQRCYALVDGTKVSLRMADKADKYVYCPSANANDIWVDGDANREFTYTETASGSHVYTLTNVTYTQALDLSWDRGGHLTLAGGKGHTRWAFIPETSITDGTFATYRARVQLYNVYQAIVAAGKTSTYASQISTARTTYVNTSATAAQLRSAAATLFRAAADGLSSSRVDVSFLFDNADMAATASCSEWGASNAIAWGQFEQYHAALTLTQTKSVPQGIYDVSFRSLYRQDGTDAAPTFTAAAQNTVTVTVPDLTAIDFNVGNDNDNGYKVGPLYVQPNDRKSASEALLHEQSEALAHNVIVGSAGQLALTVSMTSGSQWLNWQNMDVVFLGTSTATMRTELKALIDEADGIYNASYNGAAALKQKLDAARTVYNNTSASATAIYDAQQNLTEAIATYRYAAASVDFPYDCNDLLQNPSFEKGFDHWANNGMQTQDNTAFAGKDGNLYVEKWVSAGNAVGDGSVTQVIEGLPLGRYMLKAHAQNIQEGNTAATQQGASLVGNLNTTAVSANADYTLLWTNIEADATVGFVAEGATGNWMGVDNFQLYYVGNALSDLRAELQNYISRAQSVQGLKMEASVRSALETAISNGQTELGKSTTTGYPAVAKALREAKDAAKVSSDAFQALQDAITLAEQRYGSGSMTGADVFLDAINQAKDVNNNLSSTQEQMQAEISNLELAYRRYRVTNGTGTAPVVTTNPRYARGCIEAFGRMDVSGSNILEQGFCYSETNPEPTVLDQCGTDYLDYNGRIYRMPMKPGTTYYIRAYAITNTYAVGYGDVIRMSTLPQGDVRWWYNYGGPENQNNRIVAALTDACNWWTNYTSIRGFTVSCTYSPGTPTADCGYGGNMRMGTNMGQRSGTCLHEMQHGVGCGTLGIWGGWENSWMRTSMNGDWAGEHANAALRFWENRDDLVVTAAYDNGHWGFRPFNGVYEEGGGGTAIWENKYAFNGAHLDAGAWAGPKTWNDIQAVYIGSSTIVQGMMEDGLVPVNYYSGGFCLPAYVLDYRDNQKYYIKNEDAEHGLFDSFLAENEDGTLSWKQTKTERSQWYISFNAATQYYQFRNAATGHYIKYSADGTNGFRANGTAGTTDAEQFHVMRSRKDVSVNGTTMDGGYRGYWLMRINGGNMPSALTANNNGATSAATVNLYDSGTTQRWLFITADELDDFDDSAAGVKLDELRRLIAGFKAAKNVPHQQKVGGADNALSSSISNIESAISGSVTLEQVNNFIETIKTDGATFLANTQPTSLPSDLTFLMTNADLSLGTLGWSENATYNNDAVEFFSRNFDFYQTLDNMPAGSYKFTAQAFQRPGDNATVYSDYAAGNDNVNATIYINTTTEKIKNIMSEAQTTSLSSGEYTTTDNTYVPNDMTSGSAYFTAGLYANAVEAESTVNKGTLRIGVKGSGSGSYWAMVDNFHLYYYGSDFVYDSPKDEMIANGWERLTELPSDYSRYFFSLWDHEQDLGVVVKQGNYQHPDNNYDYLAMWYDAAGNPMTNKDALWTLDSFVQDDTEYQVMASAMHPDAMLQTEWNRSWLYHTSDNGGDGNLGWGRTKYVYSTDQQSWTIQNGVYPEAGYLGPWEPGIYTETALNKTEGNVGHFDVFSILRGEYVKRFEKIDEATVDAPLNITYVLENPGAERRNSVGWKHVGDDWEAQTNGILSGYVGTRYFQQWKAAGIGDAELYQTVYGLPNGYYRFSAIAHGAEGFNLYANDETAPASSTSTNTRISVITCLTDGEALRLGFKADKVTGQWIAFDDARLEYLGTEQPILTLDELAAEVPTTYGSGVKVLLKRTITAKTSDTNAWNTLCLPFDMTAAQVKATFGSNTVVKELDNVTLNAGNASLYFRQVDEIVANTPYILQTDEAGTEYLISDVTLAPDALHLSVEKNGVQFVGNYVNPLVLSNTDGEDYYILTNVFKHSTGKTKMKGYRAYFHVPGTSGVKALGFDQDEATGIEEMNDETSAIEDAAVVYDLSGRRIEHPAKGFYIVNGKKVFIR